MANLLIITGYWPSRCNPISGVFIVEQIRAFTELGHKVWVVVGQSIGRRRELMSLDDLSLDAASVTLLDPRWFRFPERVSHLPFVFHRNVMSMGECVIRSIRYIRTQGVELDGALAHDLRYAISSASIWGPYLARPIVGLIHGVDPLLDRGPLNASVVKLLRSGLEHLKAAGIVGNFLREHLTNIGLDAYHFQTILNGTEVPSSYVEHIHSPSDGTKRILSVGRLIELKGHDDTLRALARLDREEGFSDWSMRIVGEGEQLNVLRELAGELGISEKVQFSGRLGREETLAAFKDCDVFCLPSWAEAFGIVYLEAMARGRPVIGCNNCGLADFVTHGLNGILVPPKDPGALSSALRMLWDKPIQLSMIATRGRKTAEQLTWKRNAQEIIDNLGLS